jgi:LytS/YehU family sensor histidine kinase
MSRWLLMVVAAILLCGFSLLLIVHGFNDVFRTEPQASVPYVPRMVAAVLWCSIYFALESISDLYDKELQLADSKAIELDLRLKVMEADSVARAIEVRQLQEQLNPHFLFNALNAVAASKNDPELVENVTRDLADYLRFTLGEARTLEPLSRELQALEKYLGIQQARFGENLDCRILCDRAAHSVLVPPMLIQPLLENALNYGAKTSDLPLRVEVSAKVTEGVLEVIVSNTGRWIPPDHSRSPSTGIRSLRKRLMLICSEHATVDFVLEPDLQGGWVRVVVRIPVAQGESPFHLAQDDNHSGVAQDSLVETK